MCNPPPDLRVDVKETTRGWFGGPLLLREMFTGGGNKHGLELRAPKAAARDLTHRQLNFAQHFAVRAKSADTATVEESDPNAVLGINAETVGHLGPIEGAIVRRSVSVSL